MRQPDGARRSWVLLAPALILIAGWWLLPALQTVWLAVADGGSFGAPDHLRSVVTDGGIREAIRNTIVWMVGVSIGATAAGLGLAALADRLRTQRALVSFVLLPTVMAPVAIAVIWRLTLAFRPAGTDQVGVVNAVLTTPGLSPVAWLTQAPLNTVLLAGALVWMQTGVAMLVLSAAIGRVPEDVRDAARVDGASDAQIFGRITVPTIKGAILLAGVTSAAVAVRVFDLVWVGTGGQYGTSVLGTEMFDHAFVQNDSGMGATLALVMLAAMSPFAYLAVRRLRRNLVAS